MENGVILLDVDGQNLGLDFILSLICQKIVECELASEEAATQLKELWMLKHRHQFEGPRKAEGNLSSVLKELLVQKLESKATSSGLRPSAGQDMRRGSIAAGLLGTSKPAPKLETRDKVAFS